MLLGEKLYGRVVHNPTKQPIQHYRNYEAVPQSQPNTIRLPAKLLYERAIYTEAIANWSDTAMKKPKLCAV